jgi:hypothetical protein
MMSAFREALLKRDISFIRMVPKKLRHYLEQLEGMRIGTRKQDWKARIGLREVQGRPGLCGGPYKLLENG